MVRLDKGGLHPAGLGYLKPLLEIEGHNPLRIDLQLLADEVGCGLATVDGAVSPRRRQPDVVVAVEVAQEVGAAPFYRAVAESIHTDRKSRHDLVEWTSSLVGLFSSRCHLVGGCRGPRRVFSIPGH